MGEPLRSTWQKPRQLDHGRAAELSHSDIATVVSGLRKVVDVRPAGDAISRRRGG